MKKARVIVTTSVVIALILFVCLVPLPISRIRGQALVQAPPDATSQVVLKRTSVLAELKVRPGDTVREGDPLAVFKSPELQDELAAARSERAAADLQVELLRAQREGLDKEEVAKAEAALEKAKAKVLSLEVLEKELVLLAPRDGVVGTAPRLDDVGKLFEGSREQAQAQAQPLFTINAPAQFRLCMPLETSEYNKLRENQLESYEEKRTTGQDRPLGVKLRVQGLDSATWKGEIAGLDESEARYIPVPLSSRGGGPVAVQPPSGKSPGLVPQTQHYLVYIDVVDPSPNIKIGAMAQVKIYCRHETCLHWAWRTVNNVFNLRLL